MFIVYLYQMMLVNVKLDISVATSRLHFKVADFTCLVHF